jgi:hypothetical protein
VRTAIFIFAALCVLAALAWGMVFALIIGLGLRLPRKTVMAQGLRIF